MTNGDPETDTSHETRIDDSEPRLGEASLPMDDIEAEGDTDDCSHSFPDSTPKLQRLVADAVQPRPVAPADSGKVGSSSPLTPSLQLEAPILVSAVSEQGLVALLQQIDRKVTVTRDRRF